MMNVSILGLVKSLGALSLGAAFVWGSAERMKAESPCQVVIHVAEPNVEVRIDGLDYFVAKAWDRPIEAELSPGTHVLTMRRSGKLLHREEFSAVCGETLILTAWDEEGQAAARSRVGLERRSAARAGLPGIVAD